MNRAIVMLLVLVPALNSYSAERVDWATAILQEHRDSLSPSQLTLAEQYVHVLRLREQGNDTLLIPALDQLFELAEADHVEGQLGALWKLFYFDYGGIPMLITGSVRNDKSLDTPTKLSLIRVQEERSGDSRISDTVIDIIRETESVEKAIEECQRYIAAGKDPVHFKVRLCELRLDYQEELIGEALRERGIVVEVWRPELVEEYPQFDLALEEARAAVREYPEAFPRFKSAISQAIGLEIPKTDEILVFFDEGVKLMKESGRVPAAEVEKTRREVEQVREKAGRPSPKIK